MSTTHDESYLGDGLYASFDGYGITLRAPRIGGDHEVYLEPEVYRALATFREQTVQKMRKVVLGEK